ncbi:MAG: beta-ketoacyl-ACP synthase III [Acidobacteriota bacterium]
MTSRRATITSVGRFVPEKRLTNFDLERMVDTSDQWIRERTGIRERHIADAGMSTSDLATAAAREALARRGLAPDDIPLIIVGTVTPDMMFPATACLVQQKLGASHAWGFDLSAACCGFVYSLTAATQLVAGGAHDRALVIGADVMSRIIDYKDLATCVIFGDGAGAVLIEATEDDTVGLLDFYHRVDGSGGQYLFMPGGGSLHPATQATVAQRMHYVHQDGRQVFRYAVRQSAEAALELLSRNDLEPSDISLFVAHQANARILDATAHRLGLPPHKVIRNIDRFGNTTAATIPLALWDACEEGRLKEGDLVLFCSVGAGFTVGACLMRWSGLRSS